MEKVTFLILFMVILSMGGLYASPIRENEESQFYEGDFGYSIENEKAIITNYEGSDENLIIPEKLGGYEVTNIGERAFVGYTSLITLEIPNSVTSIGSATFLNCNKLTSIELDKNHPVYSFSEGVLFDRKQKMLHSYLASNKETSYVIPNSVMHIGDDAFFSCDSLTEIVIPNSVTSIGYEAFSFCKSLTTLEIPNSLMHIGDDAFFNCTSLTTVEIPDSVRHIGKNAFWSCDNVILTLTSGSYAHEYALTNDIDFVLE